MKSNTKEIGLEEYIEEYLIDKKIGYRRRVNSNYSPGLCMDTDLVLEFIKKSQEEAWEKLAEQHGKDLEEKFLMRLHEQIKERGLLDVSRNGIVDHGVKFKLAYFKPETGLNKETQDLYDQNILSVIRQVHYSEKDPDKSIDMVLFLNGLPIFTVELKNQLTGQSIKNGLQQYRVDRDPREFLLGFKHCLAHFAVDTEQVVMTTKLEGLRTRFLPFDKGVDNGAGNPVNPKGYKTSYMWEDVWTKDSLMEIIAQFLTIQTEEKEDVRGRPVRVESLIFPRYHQLDTVRRLIADAKESGSGKNYLIQHSAGSGKSNTIAWAGHRLSELHDKNNLPVFDSVIVVTDRRILDRQLSDTINQFAQVKGVVVHVESGKELKQALEQGEKVITTTLQKFPVIVESVEELPGKKFAVIIDEAHSSQSGESSKSLKQVLAATSLDEAVKEDDDSKIESVEDEILKELRSRRVKSVNISFLAFTATPKQKTLELFGIKDPVDGKFYPFSLYSMKQAIEENFILDVLKNYTTYQTYFALLKKVEDDPEFKKKKAQRLLIGYVEKHEHAIEKKVAICVEHFVEKIIHQIDGRAKAMLVTKSRLHAVRFKLALDKYLKEKDYPFKAVVAFSGSVRDGGMEYTETGMNGFPERNTAEEFKKDQYKFLVAADKFQTGFDQPLLCVMYVDKKLGGINAVQTLSRLNRTYPGKEKVFVLDFVNETEEIKEAFQPYYTTTVLSEATDPNIVYDLQRDVMNYKMFTEDEINGFVENYFSGAKPAVLNSFLDTVINRFNRYLPEEKEQFRQKMQDFTRRYAFVSQIITFEDTALEKLYIFGKMLIRKLSVIRERLPFEILESVDIESYKLTKTQQSPISLGNQPGELYPMQSGGHGIAHEELDPLSRIIKDINERFGTDFSAEDRVITQNLSRRLINNVDLQGSIKNNNRDAAKLKFNDLFQTELVNLLNSHFNYYQKLDKNPELKDEVRDKLFDYVHNKVRINS